jgi:hypothetical protein
VQIRIDLTTLLALNNNPAELTGHGPIPADHARDLLRDLLRDLATDTDWHRLITDPTTGATLQHSTHAYTPPRALRDFIRTRDTTCQFPHCHQPAHRCDIDHRIPHAAGGPTTAHNLHTLCRRHHRLKTHHRWRYTPNPDGTLTWTTPTGHTYTRSDE